MPFTYFRYLCYLIDPSFQGVNKLFLSLFENKTDKLIKLDADLKTIQQINFSRNLENNATIFFIIQEAKETVLDFSKGTVKVFWFYFVLM